MKSSPWEYGPQLVSSLEIEAVCDCFEDQLRHGRQPIIREFEQRVSPDQRTHLIRELLQLDAEWRIRRGEQVLLERYVAEFPEIKQPLDAYVDFCASLYQLISPDRRSDSGRDFEATRGTDCERAGESIPQEPDRLFGRYVLLEILGRGATSHVFRAYDVTLRREVAIKMLKADLTGDRQMVRRFLHEAQLLSSLQHPHVARVLEVGNLERPYWVAELVDGRTLSQELEQRGRFTPQDAARLMASIAEAVEAVNRRGFVHRDLKPANVLMDTAGRPVLSDFGLALPLDDEGQVPAAGWIGGSLPYMSPEQFQGEPQGPWSEVYSLGAVLFELLTGNRVQSDFEVSASARTGDANQRIRGLQSRRIPRDLQAICLRALAESRQERYSDCGELAGDLRSFLAHRPVSARPASLSHRVRLGLQRNSWAVAMIGLILVASAALATLYFQRQMAASQTAESQRQALELRLRREAALGRFSRITHIERTVGWSRRAQALLNDLRVSDDRFDSQPYQTLCQTGLDAKPNWADPNNDASHVAWSPDGTRLAIAGGSHRPAIRSVSTGNREAFGVAAPGPVRWMSPNTARQLVLADSHRALIYQSDREQPVISLQISDHWKFRMEMPTRAPNCILSPDADTVAALVEKGSGEFGVAWCSLSDPVFQFREMNAEPLCLEFGPASRWLAVGTATGQIEILNCAGGEVLAQWEVGRERLRSLAHFPAVLEPAMETNGPDRDSVQAENQIGVPRISGCLAVGDDGGTVRVLEIPQGEIKLVLRGGLHQVLSLAFNRDGTLLASAGRTEIRIFDAANGELALRVNSVNDQTFDHVVDLDFSPKGGQLAFASRGVFAVPLSASLELSFDRGIRTLRGLDSQIWRLGFSPSGKWLAALDQRWNLAVWDVVSGRLMWRFRPHIGFTVDNAAIHFDERTERLTFVAGSYGSQWNLATGTRLNHWILPPGLQDTLLENPERQLLLIRYERNGSSGVPKPRRAEDPDARQIVVRELQTAGGLRELCRIDDFSQRIDSILTPAEGHVFVARGNAFDSQNVPSPLIGLYEAETGKRLPVDWRHRYPARGGQALFSFLKLADPIVQIEPIASRIPQADGPVARLSPRKRPLQFEFPAGTAMASLSGDASLIAIREDNDRDGLSRYLEIWSTDPPRRILQIPVLGSVGLEQCEFDGTTTRVAWSNARGHVFWMELDSSEKTIPGVPSLH